MPRRLYAPEALERRLALTTYYVSAAGNDAADGLTPETAWQTIDRATIAGEFVPLYYGFQYQPGDSLLFRGGDTFTGQAVFGRHNLAGTADNPVTIGSYGNGRATFRSDTTVGHPSVITFYDTGGVTLQDVNVYGPGRQEGDYFHAIVFVDQAEDLAETVDRYRGITLARVDAGYASGAGLKFYSPKDSAGSPDLLGYGGITITDSVFHDNREAGVTFGHRLFGGYYPFTDVTIQRVRSHDNPGSDGLTNGHGFSIGGVDGGLIEHCISYSNGYENRNGLYGGASGFLFLDSNGLLIQNNESFNSFVAWDDPQYLDGHGFNLDRGTTNSILQYNYSHDNYGAGFAIIGTTPPDLSMPSLNSGNIVRFNVAENNGARHETGEIIVYGHVNNLLIHNNTVYARDYGTGRQSSTAFRTFERDNLSYSSVRVLNNVFQTGYDVPVMLVDAGQDGELPQFLGNVYWMETGRFEFYVDRVRYDSLAAFRAATGEERLGGTTDVGLQVDPRVTGPGTGGTYFDMGGFGGLSSYRMRSDSRAAGRGLDVSGLLGLDVGSQDFFGNALTGSNPTSNPGADQGGSRFSAAVIADSELEFSGVQGQDGWYYGRSASQVGVHFPAIHDFALLPVYNASANQWQQNAGSDPGLVVDATGGHPGTGGGVANQWSIRRWVSDYTGYVTLSGLIEHDLTNAGDGSNARIFLNRRPIHTEMTTPSYDSYRPQQFYTVTLWLNAGDEIDMVIDPRGNSVADGTRFTMQVTTVPGEFARVADSYRDFNGMQGEPDSSGLGNWQYGHYGTKYVPATFTTEGWVYDYPAGYWRNAEQPFAIHGAGELCPGPNNFAARRWVSGTSGLVSLDLRARRNNEAFPGGDGVVVRVYHNAGQILMFDIEGLVQLNSVDPSQPDAVDIVARQFRIPLNINPGDNIDIVVEMKGNFFYDSTEVVASFTLRTATETSPAVTPAWLQMAAAPEATATTAKDNKPALFAALVGDQGQA
jgi:hypothetical protein